MPFGVNYPPGFGLDEIITFGTSAMIYHDVSSQTVIKFPHGEEIQYYLTNEVKIYERLNNEGGHEGLPRYYGSYESGLRLEYASNGDLHDFLQLYNKDIGINQRISWASQIADTFRFVHSRDIIHGDLTCRNILLDANLNAKLADFGGSSLDGSPLLVAVTASHRHPRRILSVQLDIFAFGSTLYEIRTGHLPWRQFSDQKIQERYKEGLFPRTNHLGPVGDIIVSCWAGKYNSFDAIVADIEALYELVEAPKGGHIVPQSANSNAVFQYSALVVAGAAGLCLGVGLAYHWRWARN